VQDIAVFIRGDYDNRSIDETAKKTVLDATVLACEDVQKTAEGGLKIIEDIRAKVQCYLPFRYYIGLIIQVAELETTTFLSIQVAVENITTQNEVYLQGLQASITDARHNVQVAQGNIRQEQDSINILNGKIKDSQTAALASDVGVSVVQLNPYQDYPLTVPVYHCD